MDRYFKLRIPFATKKYIKKENNGLLIRGNAYFIFDLYKKVFIDEYIEIIEGNYRITDYDIIKPTDYYKNKLFRNFRDNFLDMYSNHNPKEIKTVTHQKLKSNEIIEINKSFKEMHTTVKSMFACLSGSNITGAETNNKASPMRCIDNEYFDCNFANVIKHYEAKKKDKKKIDDKNIKTYRLFDVINNELIDGFDELFFEYNKDFEYRENIDFIYIPEDNQKDYIIVDINNKFKIKEKQKDFLLSIVYKTIDDYETFIQSDRYNKKLRSYFTSNVNDYIRKKLIPLHSTTLMNNLSMYDNAHIIKFSTLIDTLKYEDLFDAINPYNCLRIEKNIHKLFDDKNIFFNINGDIINKDKKILHKEYLNMKNMPIETKKYFIKYLNQQN